VFVLADCVGEHIYIWFVDGHGQVKALQPDTCDIGDSAFPLEEMIANDDFMEV
jgi:hypothetical protein